MTLTVEQLARDLEQKRADMKRFLDGHVAKDEKGAPVLDSKGTRQYDLDADQIAELNKRNDELTELGKQYDAKKAVARIADENAKAMEELGRPVDPLAYPGNRDSAGGSTETRQLTDLGDLIVKGIQSYKGPANRANFALDDVQVKTLFTSTAGWAPFVPRRPDVLLSAQQQPKVMDALPKTQTGTNAIKYMEETTFTNNAAEAVEGGTYAESALALTEQTVAVQKIATFIPVTDEELEDVERLRDYLNNRLTLMIGKRLDSQLINGDGVAPNILGVLNKAGINAQALGADPVPSAIYKAMTLVRSVGFADPGAVILNPTDWQNIRLLQTADGLYIWGHPSESGPERIWGQPVIQTTFLAQGTGLTGDWAGYSELCMRRGLDIQISNSHSTYFIEGKQAIRADIRVAAIWRRAKAFAKITGLPA